MREIKFRAYSHSLKKMLSFEYLQEETKRIVDLANQKLKEITNKSNISDTQFKINKLTPYGLFLPLEDNDLEFMQYTGRIDKNGKAIYDGDVVRQQEFYSLNNNKYNNKEEKESHKRYLIKKCGAIFDDENNYHINKDWIVKFEDSRFYPFADDNFEWGLFNIKIPYEIIGNIFENPELLEVNNE